MLSENPSSLQLQKLRWVFATRAASIGSAGSTSSIAASSLLHPSANSTSWQGRHLVTGDFITAQSRWGGAIRGRLGYAVDHALFYLAGGAALASTKIAATTTGYSIGGDDTRWGWTIGGGVDYAFTDHWFTGLAYRYTQYDSKVFAYPIGFQNLGIVGFKQEMSDQRVTARIGYKF